MSAAPTAMNPAVAPLLQALDQEHKTTMRVLKAVPADQLGFKPHERNMSAGDLAWHIAYSQYGLVRVIAAGKLEAYEQPATPGTLDEIVSGGESYYQKAREALAALTPEQIQGSIPLPGGHSMPSAALMWSGVLFHQIHHRGQLSVYIRMAGGKVPSIYGPSADDNPFA